MEEEGIDGKMKSLWEHLVPTDKNEYRSFREEFVAKIGPDSFSTKTENKIYCAVLFVAFDAGFSPKRVGTLAKDGSREFVLESSCGGDFLLWESSKIECENMSGELENTTKTAFDRTPIGGYPLIANKKKDIAPFDAKGNDFYTHVINDRFKKIGVHLHTTLEQGLPRVIILSERLLDFPNEMIVLGHKYIRRHQLNVIPLQDMAGYTLESDEKCISMTNVKGPQNETALRIDVELGSNTLSIVGAHLTSKNTGTSGDSSKKIIEQTKNWMKGNGIDVLLGDLNLSTLNEPFGRIPTAESTEFVFSPPDSDSSAKTKLVPKCIDRMHIETSNGACNKFYMGQLVVSDRLTYTPTLETAYGLKMIPSVVGVELDLGTGDLLYETPPSGEVVEKRTFSDHPSLYCFYTMPEKGVKLKK